MTARFPRIPRLTLFSGPNCSLCDIAKAELAKVRQQRAFELQTVNIQDPGQEKWKRKYVYWIPALHIENKEVAKGRWDAQTVNQALDEWQTRQTQTTSEDQKTSQEENYIYERHVGQVLGDEVVEDEGSTDQRRCFNCGSPEHAVSACPDPFDHKLVSLSRQLFNFFKGEATTEFLRIHELGEWKRQRAEWLETFEPGKIQGPLLREALGLSDGDEGEYVEWLENMGLWGYPRGWVGDKDPRLRVWEILAERASGGSGDADQDQDGLFIYGEEGNSELVVLASRPPEVSEVSSEDVSEDVEGARSSPRRWASYPGTYFSSSRLPIYNGMSLPPVGDSVAPPSTTFSSDRYALWNSITDDKSLPPPPPPPPNVPPPPLPPMSAPPPLPPPPPIPLSSLSDEEGELDMELSDSD
ncbi:DUF836-domain-containing protein [Trametopsis cervina]|nr:DUF836-domain-containing protein [Trametopsis cervina]